MRYQIWDKVSNVITPVGEVLTAEQWSNRYPMTLVEGLKTVIGGGIVNGTVCMEFTGMVESYERMGCDFSECETDQDYLNAIEAFEDEQRIAQSNIVSAEERIAAALEAQVMLSMPDDEEVLEEEEE